MFVFMYRYVCIHVYSCGYASVFVCVYRCVGMGRVYVYVGILCIFAYVCMQVCEDVYVCVHTGMYCA